MRRWGPRTRVLSVAAVATLSIAGCGRINYDALDDASASATVVYYSVGTFTADLAAAGATLNISSGTVTFSLAQPDNVGVGDTVAYGAAERAYITGRTSPTVYQVATAAGRIPDDVSGAPVDSIRRTFNSITDAQASSSGAGYLGTVDLVAAETQLHWAIYDDGPLVDGEIDIDGWVTGADNYLRIFAPSALTEVGASQRHRGRAGTGARLAPVIEPGSEDIYHVLRLRTDHVRIEGLEIDGGAVIGARHICPLQVAGVAPTAMHHFDGLIIHHFTNVPAADDGDIFGIHLRQGSSRISNCVVYALRQQNTLASSLVAAIRVSTVSEGEHIFHNNTIYDIADPAGQAKAISATSVAHVVNTLSMRVDGDAFHGTFTGSHNVSSDATAPGADSRIDQTDYASYFVSVTPGSEDLHLRADSSATWGLSGLDVRADGDLPVPRDIDGANRDVPMDIGADEFGAP